MLLTIPPKPKLRSPRSKDWPKVRRSVLARQKSCEATGITKGLEVHHIQPFHLFPELELEESNLIVLTEWATFNSHFWIGHGGDWRAYNPHVRADAAQMLERIKNRKRGKSC